MTTLQCYLVHLYFWVSLVDKSHTFKISEEWNEPRYIFKNKNSLKTMMKVFKDWSEYLLNVLPIIYFNCLGCQNLKKGPSFSPYFKSKNESMSGRNPNFTFSYEIREIWYSKCNIIRAQKNILWCLNNKINIFYVSGLSRYLNWKIWVQPSLLVFS